MCGPPPRLPGAPRVRPGENKSEPHSLMLVMEEPAIQSNCMWHGTPNAFLNQLRPLRWQNILIFCNSKYITNMADPEQRCLIQTLDPVTPAHFRSTLSGTTTRTHHSISFSCELVPQMIDDQEIKRRDNHTRLM